MLHTVAVTGYCTVYGSTGTCGELRGDNGCFSFSVLRHHVHSTFGFVFLLLRHSYVIPLHLLVARDPSRAGCGTAARCLRAGCGAWL